MIYYCTRLKQAGPDERIKIEDELAGNPELKYILDQLHGVDSQGDVEMVSHFIF
jgi:hypothetical protein